MLLVSWWSLNCVSVVVGVLVALWWCVRSVLVACLCGVPVVSCGVVGLVFFSYFFTKLAHLSVPNWCQRKHTILLLGLYSGLIQIYLGIWL